MSSLLPKFPRLTTTNKIKDGAFCFSPEFEQNVALWDQTPTDESLYLPAVQQICQENKIKAKTYKKYSEGTMIVFAIDQDYVVKLYCPLFAEDFQIECGFLRALSGKLAVPVPEIIATGEFESWPYLIMTQLQGEALSTRWPLFSSSEKKNIMANLAEVVVQLHNIPCSKELKPFQLDWTKFTQFQKEKAFTEQKKLGLEPLWLEQIPSYLDKYSSLVPKEFSASLLHTELIDGVWLLEPQQSSWKLTGLFDFGDSFVGHSIYDLVAIALFITRGNQELFRTFLVSYFKSEEPLTEELQHLLMMYALLHRYSHLPWYMKLCPPEPSVKSLEQLAKQWFSF